MLPSEDRPRFTRRPPSACAFNHRRFAVSLPTRACHRPAGWCMSHFLWNIAAVLDLNPPPTKQRPCRANCSTPNQPSDPEPSRFRRRVRRRTARRPQPRQSAGLPVNHRRSGNSSLPASSASCSRPRLKLSTLLPRLLIDQGERAAIVNGEMGCGKTTVGIATAVVLNAEATAAPGAFATHLVYKWRREIQETVAGAKVWVLNGPDTLVKLIKAARTVGMSSHRSGVFVLGRVRMRMGFHWKPVFTSGAPAIGDVAACAGLRHGHHRPRRRASQPGRARSRGIPQEVRPLRRAPVDADPPAQPVRQRPVLNRAQSLKRIPTIRGSHRAEADAEVRRRLPGLDAGRQHPRVHQPHGWRQASWCFSDRQATRMERAMANMEFGFGEGGYQPSEFIKRYLPQGTFDLLIADAGPRSTRTVAAPRARPWACWRRRLARPCC